MDTLPVLRFESRSGTDTAVSAPLTEQHLRSAVPAAFASAAHECLSSKYTFISTERILAALGAAGFVPVQARQTRARSASLHHGYHLIRLRRRFETVRLRDAIPELLFSNAHDGSAAHHLRAGVYRVGCFNGLVVSIAEFPVLRVLHRGDVIDDLIRAALEMCERFEVLATNVERMERTILDESQRLAFATEALALRFPDERHAGLQPAQLLVPRREEDVGSDLWRTFNVVQEHLLRGGLMGRSASNRRVRTRGITAIREDLRLNSALWELAARRVA